MTEYMSSFNVAQHYIIIGRLLWMLIKQVVTDVPKGWGGICNTPKYCGKMLYIRAGCKLSMHFHSDKDESLYILKGDAVARYIDVENASIHEIKLSEGDSVRVPMLLPHQMEAITDTTIIETSTHHEDKDSHRVMPGTISRL